jgi:hypothetical protein
MSGTSFEKFSLDDIGDPFEEIMNIKEQKGGASNSNVQTVNILEESDSNNEDSLLNESNEDDEIITSLRDQLPEDEDQLPEDEEEFTVGAREGLDTVGVPDTNVAVEEENSSVDPEAESLESLDPEEISPNTVSASNDEPTESENVNVNMVEPEMSVDVDNSDLPSGEIIVDDEDIVIDIEDGIQINDEEIIPEEKVVANEKDQSEDLFNEIMKMVPEKYRTNRTYIKRAQTLVKNCIKLKSEVSTDEIDPTNIFKLNLNIKTFDTKPNIKKLLELDFSNSYILPIVDDKKELYEILDIEYSSLLNGNLEELDNDSFIKVDNVKKINDAIKMRTNYKKGTGRFNYSLNEELNRLHEMLLPFRTGSSESSLLKRLDEDIRVFRNTFLKELPTYNKLKLENSQFSNRIELKSDDINIVGFVRLPIDFYQLNDFNRVPLSSVVYNKHNNMEFFNKLAINNQVEHLKIDIDIGDNVLLNFNTDGANVLINGSVEEFDAETNSIVVVPDDSDSNGSPKKLNINLEDPMVDVINTTLSSRSSHVEDGYKMKVFLFGESGDSSIDDFRLRKYLEEIVPSTNNVIEIIRKKSKHQEFDFNILKSILNQYHLTLNDFIFPQIIEILTLLRKNNQEELKESEKVTRTYNKFIKNPSQPEKPSISLVSDKSLKDVEPLYGKYPFFNLSKDSDSERLNWLKTRVDSGEYYFKSIVKNIIEKFKFDPDEIIQKIIEKREKIKQEFYIQEQKVETMKRDLIYDAQKCPENRIVKTYHSFKDLELDNERVGVEIDSDKRVYGETDHLVKPGMFCVLDVDGKKKLFKRNSLDEGRDIWVLETSMEIDHLVEENKDFCEYQQKKLDEINSQMFSFGGCAFNELENRCVTKELDKEIAKKYDLENRIKELTINIDSLQQEKEKEPIDQTLEKLKQIIESNNKLNQRKYQNLEKDVAEEKAKDIDPEYELLYKKIDLYLEKISKLENVEKYSLLDILIKKFGREAIPENEPKENPMNVYCKFGNKIICCECDKRMVDIFRSGDNFDENLKQLVDDLGVEEDGMYWCKNCGREIHIAEYETAEAFSKNGARDVTHATVEDEDAGTSKESTELFDSLKMFLDAEDGGITTDNKLDIMKIYKAVLGQMGIKLHEADELNLLKTVSGLCLTNIKPKIEWATTFKGKPKAIDKAYNVYTTVNTVMYTVSYMFLLLQSSVPEYKITKAHQKCVPSLDGFPLSDSGDMGINYLKCIIESLITTDTNMAPLKKVKLDVTLKSTITKLFGDDYIKFRYKKKREDMEAQIDRLKITPLNNWNEFRPPLVMYNITNKQIDSMNESEMQKLNLVDKRNVKNYLSLKLISEIDTKVNTEPVQNFMFNPALMGNSCCLANVNLSANYLNYFLETDKIREIYTKIGYVFSNESMMKNQNNIFKTYSDEIYRYPTFRNNVFSSREDITPEEITGLFETYVPSGEYVGQKRIYYNDICIYTNTPRSKITTTEYTYDDYVSLLNTIQQLNLEELQEYRVENKLSNKEKESNSANTQFEVETDLENINILKNIIIILSKNEVTGKDSYINKFFNLLRDEKDIQKIVDIWKDLTEQLSVVIDEVSSQISELLGEDTGNKVNEQLKKLGELREVFADNELSHDYVYAKSIGVNLKINLIKKYLYGYLFNIPKKIHNDIGSSEIDETEKPANWNISYNYIQKLGQIVKSSNLICDKYILEKRSEGHQIIYDSLSSLINRNNNQLRNLTAKEHEYTCRRDKKVFSKCDNRNLARLLQYVFVIIFKEMLSMQIVKGDRMARTKKTSSKVVTGAGDVGDADTDFAKNTDDSEDVLDNLAELSDGSDFVNLGEVVEMETAQRKHLVSLLVDLINEIDKDRLFLDKHSKGKMAENIEKKLESEKENNLAVMKDLDKESRQSLTNMIKLGMTTWKNLSKKPDLDLHFGETIEEEGDQDPANGDNDFAPLEFEEEREENLRDQARSELGANYTEDAFDTWNERRMANDRLDREALLDAEVMPDDDGDEYGIEAEGDDAYF